MNRSIAIYSSIGGFMLITHTGKALGVTLDKDSARFRYLFPRNLKAIIGLYSRISNLSELATAHFEMNRLATLFHICATLESALAAAKNIDREN